MSRHYLNWAEAAADLQQRGEAYVLVTVLTVKGSAPREAGTKMLVTVDSAVDTIGGGQLEFDAIEKSRELLLLGENRQQLEDYPLGPKLGQCCGGRVTLLFECFAATAPVLALFGAGHVGRALVTILAQLPLQVRWIDSRADEFPESIPAGIKKIVAADPEAEIANLPPGAFVLVMTHNHPLDYAIAEAVLKRNDTAYLGVIGSDTKAKRFRMRLAYWGFPEAVIGQMHCPVGLSAVPGKRPMEVAVSIAAQVIEHYHRKPVAAVKLLEHKSPLQEKPDLDWPALRDQLNHEDP